MFSTLRPRVWERTLTDTHLAGVGTREIPYCSQRQCRPGDIRHGAKRVLTTRQIIGPALGQRVGIRHWIFRRRVWRRYRQAHRVPQRRWSFRELRNLSSLRGQCRTIITVDGEEEPCVRSPDTCGDTQTVNGFLFDSYNKLKMRLEKEKVARLDLDRNKFDLGNSIVEGKMGTPLGSPR